MTQSIDDDERTNSMDLFKADAFQARGNDSGVWRGKTRLCGDA
jgi:hypothetical protein